MAPAYKLTYFNVTALGEPIRFLLSYGGLDFEDVRVEFEQWPALKPTMPFGQMPVLEFNGKVAHQSTSICRYLAKQVKLNGQNDWEDLEIDAAADTVNDLRSKLGAYHYESNAAAKAEREGPLFSEVLPNFLKKLDEQAQKNKGFLACGRLSWADLFFAAMLPYLNNMAKKDITGDYPNLRAVNEHVLALPAIKAWVEKRPKTSV
ncbi:glutathione S-transferase [Leptinotarsa decemlineata]|uniref:glutathione transferase n=1 Tax=Leptinotarsa decemlineata TaxID=7539 RepID=A0A1P8PEX2_LEPDE|nr:putative glutathione S-transferase sigma class member 1 [Leptinotarsa decemlineata]